ncbi:hypothetical protein FQA39_LY10820 [Lamprigera yunnana]|nr:hypothetical protein FQA39_LY10820 [Lamprigera yunnana]
MNFCILGLSEARVHVTTTLGSVNSEYFCWRAIGNVNGNYCGSAPNWIDKYDGSNHKLNEFIINTDAAFELASENQKIILLAHAKKQLTGRGKIIVSTKIIISWAQLKEFLIETFSPKQSIDELILESQTCRQLPNESIMDFTLRLDILDSKFIKAINLENNDSKTLGVLPVYQNLLSLKEPNTYREASYFCLKIENENKINQSHERLLKKP